MDGSQLPDFVARLRKKENVKFQLKQNNSAIILETGPKNIPVLSTAVITEGGIFDSAFISPAEKKDYTVYYVFRFQTEKKMVVLSATGKSFYSVSESIPAAVWDERKIQDLTGISLVGLTDNRPLIFHPELGMPKSRPLSSSKTKSTLKDAPQSYNMPGTGEEGEFEIPVGPVHAGIIEPGHFRFHVVGERINKMETRMFFLHRGLEKAAEGKTLKDGIAIAEQISGDESVANAVAYCQAVESLAGIRVPERAKYLRTVLLELERIYSHLADLGGMTMDVGFYLAASRYMLLREEMMRLNYYLTESRFLKGMQVIGGVSKDIDSAKLSETFSRLVVFNTKFRKLKNRTFESSTFLDRAFSTGYLNKNDAIRLATVGPVARASEINCDLRKFLPYAAYDKLRVFEATGSQGDVLSRFYVKADEVLESFGIILTAISALKTMDEDYAARQKKPSGLHDKLGLGWVEAPRGGCTIMVKTDKKGRIRRLACRTASFRNWVAIEKAVETIIVPDFPLVNKSFNLSYAGNDL